MSNPARKIRRQRVTRMRKAEQRLRRDHHNGVDTKTAQETYKRRVTDTTRRT